jgi:hypothetical protein
MRELLLVITVLALSGCAVLDTTTEIIEDIIPEDPVPVCEQGTAGSQWDGQTCLKFSDGTYRWVPGRKEVR